MIRVSRQHGEGIWCRENHLSSENGGQVICTSMFYYLVKLWHITAPKLKPPPTGFHPEFINSVTFKERLFMISSVLPIELVSQMT